MEWTACMKEPKLMTIKTRKEEWNVGPRAVVDGRDNPQILDKALWRRKGTVKVSQTKKPHPRKRWESKKGATVKCKKKGS